MAEQTDTDADKRSKGKDESKGKEKGKEKTKGKGKDKGKGKGGKQAHANGLSVANDARASRQVRRAKGWGGLVGFAIAAVLSWRAGVPASDLFGRALLAGIAGCLIGWGAAVTMWRAVLLAELHARLDRAHSPSPAENGNGNTNGNGKRT